VEFDQVIEVQILVDGGFPAEDLVHDFFQVDLLVLFQQLVSTILFGHAPHNSYEFVGLLEIHAENIGQNMF
jgi:hypothetical protein